jgi:hypothetical protein
MEPSNVTFRRRERRRGREKEIGERDIVNIKQVIIMSVRYCNCIFCVSLSIDPLKVTLKQCKNWLCFREQVCN